MAFDEHKNSSPSETGKRIVDEVRSLLWQFHDLRIAPLQEGLARIFSETLDQAIADNGIVPEIIRKQYADVETAWMQSLFETKPELLRFRDMQDWLECAEAITAKDEILDWIDHQFAGFTDDLRKLVTSVIGGRILMFGLPTDGLD